MHRSIEELALSFRRACERVQLEQHDPFSHFPRGACGDASLLLSKFLRKHGFEEITYVCGVASEEDDIRSHAWLEIEGLLVDVTADQFPNHPGPPVLVTRDRSWHAHFRETDRFRADVDAYDAITRARFSSIYRDVVQHVPAELRGGS